MNAITAIESIDFELCTFERDDGQIHVKNVSLHCSSDLHDVEIENWKT